MIKPGNWFVRSKSDPRWNSSGHSPAVGGFCCPREAEDYIQKMKKELGSPPDDLQWEYMKD